MRHFELGLLSLMVVGIVSGCSSNTPTSSSGPLDLASSVHGPSESELEGINRIYSMVAPDDDYSGIFHTNRPLQEYHETQVTPPAPLSISASIDSLSSLVCKLFTGSGRVVHQVLFNGPIDHGVFALPFNYLSQTVAAEDPYQPFVAIHAQCQFLPKDLATAELSKRDIQAPPLSSSSGRTSITKVECVTEVARKLVSRNFSPGDVMFDTDRTTLSISAGGALNLDAGFIMRGGVYNDGTNHPACAHSIVVADHHQLVSGNVDNTAGYVYFAQKLDGQATGSNDTVADFVSINDRTVKNWRNKNNLATQPLGIVHIGTAHSAGLQQNCNAQGNRTPSGNLSCPYDGKDLLLASRLSSRSSMIYVNGDHQPPVGTLNPDTNEIMDNNFAEYHSQLLEHDVNTQNLSTSMKIYGAPLAFDPNNAGVIIGNAKNESPGIGNTPQYGLRFMIRTGTASLDNHGDPHYRFDDFAKNNLHPAPQQFYPDAGSSITPSPAKYWDGLAMEDLNGDGKKDLIAIGNGRATINYPNNEIMKIFTDNDEIFMNMGDVDYGQGLDGIDDFVAVSSNFMPAHFPTDFNGQQNSGKTNDVFVVTLPAVEVAANGGFDMLLIRLSSEGGEARARNAVTKNWTTKMFSNQVFRDLSGNLISGKNMRMASMQDLTGNFALDLLAVGGSFLAAAPKLNAFWQGTDTRVPGNTFTMNMEDPAHPNSQAAFHNGSWDAITHMVVQGVKLKAGTSVNDYCNPYTWPLLPEAQAAGFTTNFGYCAVGSPKGARATALMTTVVGARAKSIPGSGFNGSSLRLLTHNP